MSCETKLDANIPEFSVAYGWMDGLSWPYRLDRNRNCGGVMIFVKKDIPSELLMKHNFPSDVEDLFVELNFRKSNGFFCHLSPTCIK